MGNRLKFIYFVFLCLLFSCKTEKSIFGVYSGENFGRIEVKRDSTFKLRGGYLDLKYFSDGTWRKTENNSVLLNSTITNTTAQLFLLKKAKEINKKKSLKFTPILVGDDSLMDYRCYLYLDSELYTSVRCDSLDLIDVNIEFTKLFVKIGYEPLLSNTTALSIPIVSEVINFENINVSQVEFSLFIEKEKFFYKSLNSFLLNRKKVNFIL